MRRGQYRDPVPRGKQAPAVAAGICRVPGIVVHQDKPNCRNRAAAPRILIV
jgi:hypothetical protein